MLATGGIVTSTASANETARTGTVTDSTVDDGIIVNLHDYDAERPFYKQDRPGAQTSTNTKYSTGINNGRSFKFGPNPFEKQRATFDEHSQKWQYTGIPNSASEMNRYHNADLHTGIVENSLSNGYPTLSSNSGGNGSLDYLFNSIDVEGQKKSYENVTGLLTKDKNGWYSFDSRTQWAQLSEDGSEFELSEGRFSDGVVPSSKGAFMPFNTKNDVDGKPNYYFGMDVTTKFIMPKNGVVATGEKNKDGTDKTTPMKFEFEGDDDVWVFVDDKLVLDLGGIHDSIGGTIDFSTGEVKAGNTTKQLSDILGTDWQDAYKQHEMKFFYLERGAGSSNCKLHFNLQTIPAGTIGVGKQITNTNTKDFSDAEFTMSVDIANETEEGTGYYGDFQTYKGQYYACKLNAPCAKPNDSELKTIGVDGKFKIKNNERAVLVGSETQPINANTKYKVTEYAADNYNDTDYKFSLNGFKNDQGGDVGGTTLGQPSAEVKVSENAWVTVSNLFVSTGAYSFIIEKKMTDEQTAPDGATFTMHVTNGDGDPYTGEYILGANGQDDTSNNLTANGGNITLTAGQYAKIVSVAPGTTFHVKETELDKDAYNDPSYEDNETGDTDGEQTITVGKNTPGKIGKITVTNSLKAPTEAKTDVKVHKTLKGRDFKKDDQFTFKVENTTVDKDGKPVEAPLPGDCTETTADSDSKSCTKALEIKDANDGKEGKETLEFGDLVFDKPGAYTYKISEEAGTADRVTYDKSYYVATIVVTKNEPKNKLSIDDNQSKVIKHTVDAEGTDTAGTPQEGFKDSYLQFENTYKPLPTDKPWSLDVTKKIDGIESTDKQFEFLLKPTDEGTGNLILDKNGCGVVDSSNSENCLTVDGNGALLRTSTSGNITKKDGLKVTLGPVKFAKEGTYTFNVTEAHGDDTDDNANGVQNGDWTMDEHSATVVVKVVNKNGKLVVESTTVYRENGSTEDKSALTFTNTYKEPETPIEPDATNTLAIKKIVDKGVWVDADVLSDGFTVTVKVHNEKYAGKTVEGTSFDENGNATHLVTIGVGKDAVLKLPTGTQIVSVKEAPANGFKSEIMVGDDAIDKDGFMLDADKTVTVTNTYTGKAELTIEGTKTVNHFAPTEGDPAFTFEVKNDPVNENVIMPKKTTATSDKDGKFSFDAIKFTQPGDYQFAVTEPADKVPTGYTGDDRGYYVSVRVGKDAETAITGYSVMSGNTMNATDEIVFNNKRTETPKPEDPKDATITVKKVVEGCDKRGLFTIGTTIDNGETQWRRYGNGESWPYTVSFKDPNGSYAFTIQENAVGTTKHQVKISATTIAADGTESTKSVDGAAFTGSVKPGDYVTVTVTNTGAACPPEVIEDGSVDFDPGYKYLTGDTTLSEDDFTFEIYRGDTVQGEWFQRTNLYKVEGKTGYFKFTNLPLTHEGANTFTIVERNDGKKGYAYDNRVYHVAFNAKVVDGKYVADGNPTITVENGELENGQVVFRNSYEKPTDPEEPDPDPTPKPDPDPDPDPDPTPDPDPEPEPEPTPKPDPEPEPEPTPKPDPDKPGEDGKPGDNGNNNGNGGKDDGTQNPNRPSLPQTGVAVASVAGVVALLAAAGIAMTIERRRKNQR